MSDPAITVIGPATGGVAHVTQQLAEHWPDAAPALVLVSDDGWVVQSGCRCSVPEEPARARGGSTALRAVRAAWRHRRCLRRSRSFHVELGRTSLGAFWFALAAGLVARTPAMVVTTHDVPSVVLHPAAALLPWGAGFRDRLAFGVVAPLLDRPVLALLRRRASATVVLSAAAGAAAQAQHWPKVTQVDHGAAPRTVPTVPSSQAGYVLLAGYLGPGKGLNVLADAWPQVQPALPLVIAGGHSQQHEAWVGSIRAQFDAADQPPTWTGYVDDDGFDLLVREAAVVVIPYEQSNPASGVLVRALVEGRAVVGTRVAAVVDEVVDEHNGLLVDPGDAAGLAAALSRLTASPELRDALGEQAAQLAAERHSWARHTAELDILHHDLAPDAAADRRVPHHV